MINRIIIGVLFLSLALLSANCGSKLPTKGTPNFPAVDRTELVSQQYYRWLTFHELPNKTKRTALEKTGVEFLGFQGGETYVACLPMDYNLPALAAENVKACMPILAKEKLAKSIQSGNVPAHASKGGDVFLNLKVYRNIVPAQAAELLKQKGIGVLEERANNVFVIQIPKGDLIKTAGLPFVSYLEPVDEIPTPE